ncbi:hypothetical protein [Dryocola sp. BD613]|uniref:hypothetical protein n=1 Tax=Dryocola sp. BD613 TaxID=3133272 RepID=UPI003F4FBCAD
MKVSCKISIFPLTLLYFVLLLFLYESFVSPLFSYMGFISDFSWERTLIACIFIILYFFLSKVEGVVGFYHQVIMALLLIPSLVLYSVGVATTLFFFVTIVSIFIVFIISSKVKLASFKLFTLNRHQLLWFLFLIALFTIFSYVYFIGMSGFNLNILKVYEFRKSAGDALPSIFGYLSPATSKIFIPIMMVLSIIYKRYFFLYAGFVFSILIFGFTAHKSPLLYPFLTFGIYLFSGARKWGVYYYTLLISVLFIAIVDFYLSDIYPGMGFGIIGSFSSRRAILLPMLLNNYYVEFFSIHEPYYWSESKLTFGLVNNPYDLKMVNLIGAQYFGQPDMSANTGFIGSGFANARWFGVILYSILLGLLISFLESLSKYIGKRFVISSSFVVMFSITTSTDFITALLTHGLLLLIVLYMIIPRSGKTSP